jgi:hypothetical protein
MHEASRAHGIVGVFAFIAMLAIGLSPGIAVAGQTGWTVQFGTSAGDNAQAVAVTGRHVYVAGRTRGTLDQPNVGGMDAFIRKYTKDGELEWSDQFGTAGDDGPQAGTMRARGKQIVLGGFVTGALPGQTWASGTDGFLRAYDRKGNALWTLQFGSAGNEQVRSIAIARDGSIFVTGHTTGRLADSPSGTATDAFAMRVDSDGTVRWLTQFGTPGDEEAIGIALGSDALYISGATSGSFPGYLNAGDFDAFVARLTFDGKIEWITQFGTPAFDVAMKVGVKGSKIFATGHTFGAFPGETALGDLDGFVTSLGPDGLLRWSRQFGTSGCDFTNGIAVDAEGPVIVGSIRGVFSAATGCGAVTSDAAVRKYDVDGNVIWVHEFGSAAFDNINDVALKGEDVYLAGATDGALGGPSAGARDAYLMRIPKLNEHHQHEHDDDDGDCDDESHEDD